MTEMTWEKSQVAVPEKRKGRRGRWQFLVGGLLILGAVGYLIFSSTLSGARFFITVDEVVGSDTYVGQTVRLTGAVIGDTIEYDSANGNLRFTIAHIPESFEDLATALHESANNPTAQRLVVYMEDETKPDLLQHEAQAIITGELGEDGVFYASELLLKCPSRFEENGPNLTGSGEQV